MRFDDAPPRTWLLAALAGWALVAWALALAGMGGRIGLLEEDPGLLRPLPPLRPAAAERLGPLGQYSEIASRPLFSTDRRPKPFSLRGANGEAQATQFDYRLTSVLITPGLQLAILQPPDGSKSVRVRVGEAPESHPAWRLTTLNPRSAVFEGPEGQRTLDLRVFDGQGGQPPTPSAAPTPRPGAPGMNNPADGSVPPPRPIVEAPRPAGTTNPAVPVPPPPRTDAPEANAPAPQTDQAQMEAIRQRIQARREQLRQQQQSRTQPPAQ
jgi:general secretion pathway protein N